MELLARHKDIFVWTHRDMPGIDLEVMVPKLNISKIARPVRQKRRNFVANKNYAIAKEVDKLL